MLELLDCFCTITNAMSRWTSIEIFDGMFSAHKWADTHADSLIETGIQSGALDWDLKRTAWGVVFEIEFKTEAAWEQYRNLPVVIEALKSTPNPSSGVLIYRGRSLDGGHRSPKKPKPFSGAGSNSLALPLAQMPFLEALPPLFSDTNVDTRRLTHS